MRAKLFILFPQQLTITPELAAWVAKQNTTAFYTEDPSAVIGTLKEKNNVLGMLNDIRTLRVHVSKENYFHTDMKDAVLAWSDFEMTEEKSETWGTYYQVTGDVIGLDSAVMQSMLSLKDIDTGRYFGTVTTVKSEKDKLNTFIGLVGVDYHPSGIDSVWSHLFDDQIIESTPAARWRVNGEKDPHGNMYDCERAKLAKGKLGDDELANAMFLCDHRTSLESIGWLTAGKERIRWLSRRLVEAEQRVAELEKNALQKDLPGQD